MQVIKLLQNLPDYPFGTIWQYEKKLLEWLKANRINYMTFEKKTEKNKGMCIYESFNR